MEALEAVLHGDRQASEIVSADVLDAWYPPSPKVIERVQELLPLLVSASPPTHNDGLRSVIASGRGVEASQVLVGSGSSSLMFLAIPRLISASDRVLVLDPMYGEYAHIAMNVVGAQVDRFELPLDSFQVDVGAFIDRAKGYRLVALVNPNSPTGVPLGLDEVRRLMEGVPSTTMVWIDRLILITFRLNRRRSSRQKGWWQSFRTWW